MIKEIKENYNVTDFFNGRIRNYRVSTSISNVFQSETSDIQFKPDEVVNSKFTVLEHITSKKVSSKQIKERVINEYSKSDKDLKITHYQILIDKFNSKYKNLNESQKKFIKKLHK